MTFQQLLDLNLLETFGLEKVSKEEQKKFLDYAVGIILDRAIKQVLEELPKEKREGFLEVMKGTVPEAEKTQFLNKNVPDLEAIIMEEILVFKKEAMGIAKEIGE